MSNSVNFYEFIGFVTFNIAVQTSCRPIPVSTGIGPQSLSEWAFRARPGPPGFPIRGIALPWIPVGNSREFFRIAKFEKNSPNWS